MAVLSTLPGVSVTVLVGGVVAQEYDCPPDDDGPEPEETEFGICEKYIESKEDTKFAIKIKLSSEITRKKNSVSCGVYVDNSWIQEQVLGGWGYENYNRAIVRGREYVDAATGQVMRSKFKFASLQTSDDSTKEKVAEDAKLVSELGVIQIILQYVEVHGKCSPNIGETKLGSSSLISEKALKGKSLSHKTTFAAAVPYNGSRYLLSTEDIGEPLAVFKFRYRSKDDLYNEGIISRPPSPSPTPSPVPDVSTMSREALEKLALVGLAKIKMEKRESNNKMARGSTKRELEETIDLTETPAPKKARSASQVVDLTDS